MTISGTYCLCLEVNQDTEIEIGALGQFNFVKGKYLYVGSALNNLEARVKRHINSNKTKQPITHWHIDYLLKSPHVNIYSILTLESTQKMECQAALVILKFGDPVKKFGCSDCKCISHLYKVNDCSFIERLGFTKFKQKEENYHQQFD